MLYGGLLRTQSHTWLLFSDKMLVQSMLPRRCRRWIILWLVTGAAYHLAGLSRCASAVTRVRTTPTTQQLN
jgi:hypothetical protein